MINRFSNIFDTHAHYTDRRFAQGRTQLLRDLPANGVSLVLNCGSDLADSAAALALSQEYPHIYAACGVHPHEASGFGQQGEDGLRALLQDTRCVAVGEIGLDYHYDFSPRDVQRDVFRRQLNLVAEQNLPVIIHDREAHEDTLHILQEFYPKDAKNPGVVHCFSGSAEFAKEILALGFSLGFGGAVTFKNAKRPLAVAAEIPLERLLLETDAPYMAPEPFRGKRCESPHIAYVAEKIAAARGMDAQALIDICSQNGRALFGIVG